MLLPVLGEFALWTALPIAIWGLVLAFLGGRWGRGDLVLSAERSVHAVTFLLVLASAGIISAFLNDQYQYWYVYNYSNRELATFYKVAGLWAGQRGSLVFWALNLAIFSSLAVYFNRARNREFMPYVVGVLLVIQAFFLIICLFVSNAFELLAFTPPDGRGLNPQLQNYWMVIHPPTLYLGFTSFSIPFAFAIAALMSGRLDARWIEVTRRWILLSWFFLANGIIFGMRWAYEELGWGGYWFWDPVENASLLPWLAATAFLHSVMIQEYRGMLKVWNMSLVILTFLLTVFATFLTRSGLIESVHSFAQNLTIAWIFLGFLAGVAVISYGLLIWRLPRLRSDQPFESFVSRESAFLLNNLILLGALFAVLWGTLFPLITEGFTGSKVAVGPPFFNQVNIPIGLALLALMGVGPVIAWRRASKRNLLRNFALPVSVGLVLTLALALGGMRHGYALATFGIGAFVLAVIVVEFWKGTQARARIEGEGSLLALFHLVSRNRRRWGGYIVHVGVVVIFMGFGGAAFDVEVRQSVLPGETISLASPYGHRYELTYEGISTSRAQNMIQWVALLQVYKDGEPVGTITSEKRQYITTQQPVSEVGIRSTLMEDLYVILATVDDMPGVFLNSPQSERATFQVMVNPLVGWIWYGALILTVGTLIALWPPRGPLRASGRGTATPGVGAAHPRGDPSPSVPAGVGG
ncbi:MAG: heme lyase CcmF/NrfE family subunit [Gemmatimonadota bacterium]